MEISSIRMEIIRLVGLQLGSRRVESNQRLIEDLGAESADIANIVAALEDKYHITITETEIAQLRSVSDLVHLVAARI